MFPVIWGGPVTAAKLRLVFLVQALALRSLVSSLGAPAVAGLDFDRMFGKFRQNLLGEKKRGIFFFWWYHSHS